jgi:hypothetical protein
MGLQVKLTAEVSGGVWSASGTFTGTNDKSERVEGPAEVLVQVARGKKKTDPVTAQLILDSALKETRIMGHKIISYSAAVPVEIAAAEEGTEISFKDFWFNAENVKK